MLDWVGKHSKDPNAHHNKLHHETHEEGGDDVIAISGANVTIDGVPLSDIFNKTDGVFDVLYKMDFTEGLDVKSSLTLYSDDLFTNQLFITCALAGTGITGTPGKYIELKTFSDLYIIPDGINQIAEIQSGTPQVTWKRGSGESVTHRFTYAGTNEQWIDILSGANAQLVEQFSRDLGVTSCNAIMYTSNSSHEYYVTLNDEIVGTFHYSVLLRNYRAIMELVAPGDVEMWLGIYNAVGYSEFWTRDTHSKATLTHNAMSEYYAEVGNYSASLTVVPTSAVLQLEQLHTVVSLLTSETKNELSLMSDWVTHNLYVGITTTLEPYVKSEGDLNLISWLTTTLQLLNGSFVFVPDGVNTRLTISDTLISTDVDVEITDSTNGLILKSPGGSRYRVTVEDDGSLVTELVV